jgi:DNA-binding NarL/FixJ family response regulator
MDVCRIGIVDDHKIVRDGLKLMLLGNPKHLIIFDADTIPHLLELLNHTVPDLLILDLNLPGTGGLEVIDALRARHCDMKILVLSANFDEYSIFTAIEKGVHGYVSKDADSLELLQAIDAVSSGDQFFGETVSKIVCKSFLSHKQNFPETNADQDKPFLTDREIEVLKCFAEGMSYKEIGDILNISPRTVETHKTHIMAKLGLENLSGLIRYAIKNGIISI